MVFGGMDYTTNDTARVDLRDTSYDTIEYVPGAADTAVQRGMLLAQVTATGAWGPWDPGDATGLEIARAVVSTPFTTPSAGNAFIQAIMTGEVREGLLIEGEGAAGVATAPAAADLLVAKRTLKDNGVLAKPVLDTHKLDPNAP